MKRTDRKSHCPVNFALETVGDPWSLLVVRDIVFHGKHAFGEFLASEERITTSVLADGSVFRGENSVISQLERAAAPARPAPSIRTPNQQF